MDTADKKSGPGGRRVSSIERILGRIDDLDSTNLAILVQRLARERALFEMLFNTIDEGIIVFDDAGTVEFRGVSFSYGNGRDALSGVSVRVPAGQTVALVGPSGAGKTTFTSLISRFYDATEGAVLVGGVDVRDAAKSDLRSKIALVPQHAVLFRGTIRENIRLGREGATDAEVELAAHEAAMDDFASGVPGGLDAKLGDLGEGVSGGQRQRIAVARAFLKDAPILILDEATSALDSESEKVIQDNLEKLARGRTTFIVAHRFSSVRIARRILVFSRGRIVGDGTHDELYASCPLYRELYDRQGV